jgi:hypothetical protein
VALRTPDQLCNCPGPILSPPNARDRTTDRGITTSSQALVFLAPASSTPSPDQTHNHLASGAITAQSVENPLARPISSLPLSRRACMARWSQVIHRYPPFLENCGRACSYLHCLSPPRSRESERKNMKLLSEIHCPDVKVVFPLWISTIFSTARQTPEHQEFRACSSL